MQPPSKFSQRKVVIPIAIAALLLFGLLAAYLMRPADNQEASTNTSPSATEQVSGRPAESASQFKDGSYNAEGEYTSPGGSEAVSVSLTIKDGVVTDSTVEPQAVNPNSERYQDLFIGDYKTEVVGKSLADLQLGAVAGSSLTPNGFNDAVANIKTQAAS